jgi:hypothetical protein
LLHCALFWLMTLSLPFSLEAQTPAAPAALLPRPAAPAKRVVVKVVRPDPCVLEAARQRETTPEPAPVGEGQKAHLDPRTGELREPTPEETREFEEAIQPLFLRSTANLRPQVHPSGMISLDLDGGFMNASVARLNPDGTITRRCLTSPEAVRTFLQPVPGSATTTGRLPSSMSTRTATPAAVSAVKEASDVQ